jgi:hypothetical protein
MYPPKISEINNNVIEYHYIVNPLRWAAQLAHSPASATRHCTDWNLHNRASQRLRCSRRRPRILADPIEAAVQNVLTAANVGADVALTTCLKFAQESVS